MKAANRTDSMPEFAAQSEARKKRALELAQIFPAAAEIMLFYLALVDFQTNVAPRARKFNALCLLEQELVRFVEEHAPAGLREAAAMLDLSTFTQSISDYWQRRDTTSLVSFFARAVLQPWTVLSAEVRPIALGDNLCPRCGHLPQVAALRVQGHGKAVSLVCSLCMNEWSFRRVCCAGCLKEDSREIEFHVAVEYEYYQVQVCRACMGYLLIVDLAREPNAIPFVDEMAAPSLDLWARQQGFAKIQPNLAGI